MLRIVFKIFRISFFLFFVIVKIFYLVKDNERGKDIKLLYVNLN